MFLPKQHSLGECKHQLHPAFIATNSSYAIINVPSGPQIALLLVNLPTGDAHDADVVLQCEICRQQFEAISTLHDHLFTEHRLEVHDWLPNRDLLGADPVCSALLSLFRRKICRQAAHHEGTLPKLQCGQADWRNYRCHSACIKSFYMEIWDYCRNHQCLRLSMTLHCQLCGVRFERQQDLSLHLQTVHVDRWTQTQTTLHLLMQVGTLDITCICNPQTTNKGGLPCVPCV